MVEIKIEDKIYDDKTQAINALAFCHYPVVIQAFANQIPMDGKFESFDDAKDFVEALYLM